MLDLGWPELLVVALVLIIVVGPKDLPAMLRTFGRTTRKLRSMAGEFRSQFDEALKEAELGDVKDVLNEARQLNPTNILKDVIDPIKNAGKDIKSDLDKVMREPDKQDAESKPTVQDSTDEKLAAGKSAKPVARAAGKAPTAKPAASATAKKSAPRRTASKGKAKAAAKANGAAKATAAAKKPAAAKKAPRASTARTKSATTKTTKTSGDSA